MSFHDPRATPDTPLPANPGRRAALKGAVAAGAAALVWTEPTIKGLARRPAYAGTASGADVEVIITLDAVGLSFVTVPPGVSTIFSISLDEILGVIELGPPGTSAIFSPPISDPNSALAAMPILMGQEGQLQLADPFPDAFEITVTVQC